jgi:hypothetical protein
LACGGGQPGAQRGAPGLPKECWIANRSCRRARQARTAGVHSQRLGRSCLSSKQWRATGCAAPRLFLNPRFRRKGAACQKATALDSRSLSPARPFFSIISTGPSRRNADPFHFSSRRPCTGKLISTTLSPGPSVVFDFSHNFLIGTLTLWAVLSRALDQVYGVTEYSVIDLLILHIARKNHTWCRQSRVIFMPRYTATNFASVNSPLHTI